ncbi:uncharacterized protein TRUGW13939_10809 [Talaromyces rugulosus]|uniref:Uncharacterized protein n=1 Tax=Talaromyces rugulosus TaxID=121627 RepID=A0A7H8RCB6_TALRU|nr:uncharacterized protein TRUGW13939_10809 [Talaromyces rugulosus]QKX63638.1 hypothetical protein TRUGW13939_10809 [Talaromyces rugulosus]
MESASVVSSSPPPEDKSYHHDEPLQLHSMPPWRRYESEEEEVSETSSVRAFTPETGSSNDNDPVVESGLPSPAREDSDSSASLYSRPLSVVTAKRNSTATYNAYHEGDENESACGYVTPPVSPTSILPHSIGEADTSIVIEDDGEEAEEEEQIFEAKQVLYTAPTSKPNIIVIHNLTSESMLWPHSGNEETPDPASNKGPENIRKRSSTASGLSPPDRSKRYSAMFLRDDGELAYADPRSHVRARSAQRVGGSPYRSRAASPSVNRETRPQLLRRNTSQRSTRSVYIAAPDEMLRPRTFRSASFASDNTSPSSRSSKQPSTLNSSTSSFHTSSTSSAEPDSDKSKLTPHPLSISTTSHPAPIQFTGPFGTSPRKPGLAPHVRSESLLDVDPISPAASSAYSPMEQTNPRMSMPKAQGLYSLRNNPALSLTTDFEPAVDQRHQQAQQANRDWSFVSSPASAKTPKAGASAMKSLMGGFRGLGRPRKRSLAPAPN